MTSKNIGLKYKQKRVKLEEPQKDKTEQVKQDCIRAAILCDAAMQKTGEDAKACTVAAACILPVALALVVDSLVRILLHYGVI